jgi:hypothetical protein
MRLIIPNKLSFDSILIRDVFFKLEAENNEFSKKSIFIDFRSMCVTEEPDKYRTS